jgi:hypothetical protein
MALEKARPLAVAAAVGDIRDKQSKVQGMFYIQMSAAATVTDV